jgi:putative phosphoesterase
MRIALLSDIHSNKAALKPVLQEISELRIQNIIISGDLLGYYYDIIEVLNMLDPFTIFFCKGNHELMFENLINFKIDKIELKSKYGSSLLRAENELNSDQINFLTNSDHPLELTLEGKRILVSHGAPWDINEYIYQDNFALLYKKFISYNYQIFILGNTHHQMKIEIDKKIFINPGSVGQSRKNFGYAEWATLDLENMKIDFFSTRYPTEELIEQCKTIDPSCFLLTRHLS